MQEYLDFAIELVTKDRGRAIAQSIAIWLVAYVILKVSRRRIAAGTLHPQHRLLIVRLLTLLLYGLALTSSLQILGVELGVLLGAAGILTVALGFAAQASVSNLISGIFLMFEQPFRIGDAIRVGDVAGEVVSIGLVSLSLRTPDNLLVRIPNETMLKSNVINQTRYPIRRLDLPIGVAYHSKIAEVRAALLRVVNEHRLCLDEPLPRVMHLGFGASSIDLQLVVWVAKENFLDVRDQLNEAIKEEFDRCGIEIPFPNMTLSVGREPLVVRMHEASGDELRSSAN
jgi:small-conductance mechanosensitive channel